MLPPQFCHALRQEDSIQDTFFFFLPKKYFSFITPFTLIFNLSQKTGLKTTFEEFLEIIQKISNVHFFVQHLTNCKIEHYITKEGIFAIANMY